MRYNLGLQVLVGNPSNVCREEVHLDRQTPLRGLQLAHHNHHIVVYALVLIQIAVYRTHKHIEVGEHTALDALRKNAW